MIKNSVEANPGPIFTVHKYECTLEVSRRYFTIVVGEYLSNDKYSYLYTVYILVPFNFFPVNAMSQFLCMP